VTGKAALIKGGSTSSALRTAVAGHVPVVLSAPRNVGARTEGFVEFEHVDKTYDGERLAVKDLTLSIARGEFLTLLGPSGSGKTTALMILAGFEAPTGGEIRLDGRSLRRVPPYQRNIGVVFQNYALFPHMTVAENLAFPLSVRKVAKSEVASRVGRALDLVRLKGFEKRRPTELSGGQQQRVALARALIFDPALILMDEPLGALDKQLREQLQIEIKHIQKELGLTVAYVTHDQSEALTMSDRIAVFNDGSVQQLASPAELYERPRNAFVAQFIGESSRLTGLIHAIGADGLCKVEIEGGEIVEALAVNIGAPGSRTILSVRPERVIVHPRENECDTVLTALVEELIYHGDHTRVRLSVHGSHDFLVKVPHGHRDVGINSGETITIGWRSVDCRALDAPQR
jgi:putative spermidine/putrescine transport system ATP-binding protein